MLSKESLMKSRKSVDVRESFLFSSIEIGVRETFAKKKIKTSKKENKKLTFKLSEIISKFGKCWLLV
jgi:hypothetical protein